MKRIAICLLALYLATPAWGQGLSTGKAIVELGRGSPTCGTWIKARNSRNRTDANMYAAWTMGFLSGVAMYGTNLDPMNGTNFAGVEAWLDKHCHANPLIEFTDAIGAFVIEHPR